MPRRAAASVPRVRRSHRDAHARPPSWTCRRPTSPPPCAERRLAWSPILPFALACSNLPPLRRVSASGFYANVFKKSGHIRPRRGELVDVPDRSPRPRDAVREVDGAAPQGDGGRRGRVGDRANEGDSSGPRANVRAVRQSSHEDARSCRERFPRRAHGAREDAAPRSREQSGDGPRGVIWSRIGLLSPTRLRTPPLRRPPRPRGPLAAALLRPVGEDARACDRV